MANPADTVESLKFFITILFPLILAIWMLPENNNVYGGWPIGGEIDIAELRCNRDYRNPRGVNQGIQRYGATLHFGPKRGYDGWRHAHWQL